MKRILISILLCLGVFFSPAFAQDSALLERAQAGNAEAQYNLGVMYANGDGVKQSEGRATYWYCKAAEQGNKTAKNNLTSRGRSGSC